MRCRLGADSHPNAAQEPCRAGVLRDKPDIKWTKGLSKEPVRPRAEYPWFWEWDERTENCVGGSEFDGNRWNDCRYTDIRSKKWRVM